ncbi:MAG: B12-binding domain-containing radical SAM protein [Nitrospinota bacterium]|nr:B12-binding domain-containing radical SAM protein [Nitrospinota bacterium]
MKVAFVYPDAESIGVQSLMSVLEKEGHEVDFVFYSANDSYTNFVNHDLDFAALAGKVAELAPDVVAFSAVSDIFKSQVRVAAELKKISGATTIFGGIHPTLLPKETLARDEVDALAMGEAEVSLPRWLASLKVNGSVIMPDKATNGIIHKRNGSMIGDFTIGDLPNMDELPFPNKEPFMAYLPEMKDEYLAMTGRGCPYACSYCAYSYTNGGGRKRNIRQTNVDRVIAEFKRAKEHLGVKYFVLVDDCFTTHTEWLEEFCRKYKTEVGLPFQCITSPFQQNEHKADLLKEAGCVNVQMGVQSVSEDLCRDILFRKSNNKKIEEAIAMTKARGIMVRVDHMLGVPEDTVENQEDAMRFYNKVRPDGISVFWLKYYPKTKIIDQAVTSGLMTESEAAEINDPNLEQPSDPSFYYGGSVSDARRLAAVAFILHWLPHLPRWFVNFLVNTGTYRIFAIKNFYLSIAIPRLITCMTDKRDFRATSHVKRFVKRYSGKLNPFN